jgi:polyphosphate kinase
MNATSGIASSKRTFTVLEWGPASQVGAAGSDDPLDGEFLIGSAEWMHRNLSERVEAAVPIRARHLRARLWEILDACLVDHRNAWQMQPDGSYVQPSRSGTDGVGSAGTHVAMMRSALARRDL